MADAIGAEPPAAVLDNLPVLYGPDAMATSLAELEASAESARQVVAASTQPDVDIPVLVLSAADAPEATLSRRAALAAGSRDGRHEVVPGTTHYVQYQEPARVAGAILESVQVAR